jgi:hypothetical protein
VKISHIKISIKQMFSHTGITKSLSNTLFRTISREEFDDFAHCSYFVNLSKQWICKYEGQSVNRSKTAVMNVIRIKFSMCISR